MIFLFSIGNEGINKQEVRTMAKNETMQELEPTPTEVKTTSEIQKGEALAKFDQLQKAAENQHNRIYKTLNETMTFSVSVADTDTIQLNNTDLNDTLKSVKRVRVAMDSTEAKKQISDRFGAKIDDWVKVSDELKPEISILLKNKLANYQKKLAKFLLVG